MGVIHTRLFVTNHTKYQLQITVNEIDNFDWASHHRPDHNFQEKTILSGATCSEPQELNGNASSSNFRFNFQARGEVGEARILHFSFRNDQRDAKKELCRYYSIEGPDRQYFQVIQHSDGSGNNHFIVTTLLTNEWMSYIPDETPITALTIPGTHDSATYCGAEGIHSIMNPWVKTQTQSIAQQLLDGIRFLDIRCRHIGNLFTIHHGAYYVQLSFNHVLQECSTFLQAHPTETIILSMKEEHEPERNNRSFADTFRANYIEGYPWYRGQDLPNCLGDARGKIVLLSRSGELGCGFGFQFSDGWRDSAYTDAPTYYIQDLYNVDSACDNKVRQIKDTIDLARQEFQNNPNRLFINFTSASNGAQPIMSLVEKILPRVTRNLPPDKGRFGIIVIDFYTIELVRRLIKSNSSIPMY